MASARSLPTPGWSGEPVWIHGDLLPGNLLFQGGRLSGVIDWAGLGVGDPACDMIVAWGLLPRSARNAFRGALGVDDATWGRGRGSALSIGLIALPYYKDTNPEFAATALHLIRFSPITRATRDATTSIFRPKANPRTRSYPRNEDRGPT
jgi:aminoglycoside phosphotransferase (APT) family kinase protein